MVGGNVGGVAFQLDVPEQELFIRWTQLAMFLPTVQFSLTPWEKEYDITVQENAIAMAKLRAKYVTPILLDFQQNKNKIGTLQHGFPVTPLWWIDQNSNQAYIEKESYLVGTKILVAAVSHKDERGRYVYFPNFGDEETVWKRIDVASQEVIENSSYKGGSNVWFDLDLFDVGLFQRQ